LSNICLAIGVWWREIKVQVGARAIREQLYISERSQLLRAKPATKRAHRGQKWQENRTSYTCPPMTCCSSPPTLLCLFRPAIFNVAAKMMTTDDDRVP